MAVPHKRPNRGADIDRAKLTRLRIGKGWSVGELAKQAGTSKPHMSRIENGIKRPSPALAAKLAEVLGLNDASELLVK